MSVDLIEHSRSSFVETHH